MMGIASFVSALENVLATAFDVHRGGPPRSLNSADLPRAWVEAPAGESAFVTFDGGTFRTYTVTVCVAFQAVGEGLSEDAFSAGLAVLDELVSVLETANVCASRLTVSARLAVVSVAGTDFWAVVANVSGKGK